ncbi:MAG TPA: homoserine kinase [Fimbriimonas sp.]|nr:homoserine kinase [Fimbriimonas sp.]
MIRVRIPATTANLGPGFDCMGLALDLWNTFELHLEGERHRVETFGEGEDVLPTDESNLTISVMLQELAASGIEAPRGVRVICHNTIPCASGLGSSSTATLAGVLFAAALRQAARGEDPSVLDLEAVLARAVAVEGHGDNVAPALLGGFVIVVPDPSGVLTQRVPHLPIKTVVCVPSFAYLTTEARAALPDSYSKADAIYNIGRAMLVAEALRSGDDSLLARAMNDKIHEPYRLKSIPGAMEAKRSAKEAGAVCVALSGAGPGIIAFAREGYDRIGRSMNAEFAKAGLKSRYWILDATEQGTHVGRLPV